MAKQTKKFPSGVPVAKELIFGGWTTCTIAAAMDLDVFTIIAHGQTTANEIAREAHANESMMRRLLDTLVALKYLTRKGDRYALSRDAATFLVRGSDLYMEGAGRFATGQMTGWFQLAEVVRNGAPLTPPGGGDDGARAEFFAMLVKVIFPLNFVGATAAVASLGAGAKARIKDILDVAAGAGAWSIPFAQAIRAAHVTAVDFPQVTPVARDYASQVRRRGSATSIGKATCARLISAPIATTWSRSAISYTARVATPDASCSNDLRKLCASAEYC